MRKLQTHARFGLLMSALALMSVPSAVSAQETCAADDDCGHGYSCEVVGGCPAIDCAPGSDCEAIECEPAMGCLPVTDCEADADCAEGWTCASQERANCDDVAEPTCAQGEECVKPEPADAPDCQTETFTYCAPPWQGSCEEAADCGPGFDCVEEIAMSCSGSSGSDPGEPTPSGDPQPEDGGSSGFAPPPDGDPLPPDEPGTCTSTPTGNFICQLIETTCVTDADCGAGLTCQESPSDAVCSSGGSDGDTPDDSAGAAGAGAAGAGGAGDADFAPERPACETPEPTFACAPPNYFDGYGYGYDLEGRGENTSGGVVTPDGQSGEGDSDPSGEPPTGPMDDGNELAGGDEGAAGSGMSESSGCSATSSSRASGSALLMVLAVLGLALRRRSLRA